MRTGKEIDEDGSDESREKVKWTRGKGWKDSMLER